MLPDHTACLERARSEEMAGRVVLITGAASGIGPAIATAFAAAGATVAAVDLPGSPLAELVAAIPGMVVYAADLSDPSAAAEMVAHVERHAGPIEVCVQAAGTFSAAAVTETTAVQWRHMFAVNAEATFHVARSVAQVMIPRRRGAIVTIASDAASAPRVHSAAYAASTAAAVMFTRCLALELAPHGIRCNVVSPGPTDTATLQATGPDLTGTIAGALDRWRQGIPQRRVTQPTEIAEAVLFLCADRARHITMRELIVDGGASLI
ncbi:2,3-dihydro-2,3-dihydroxybenzoate dehydrogenase [Nonomuraea maheshkhaliensis]|uniref:2,3-dihydro-2,3-dihydroxybenzoate dehydrogenase n=1 Tax=Nonomuraea maheshkhaliensis TaxID=419590 RepID=A0ABN2F097_9ACTN